MISSAIDKVWPGYYEKMQNFKSFHFQSFLFSTIYTVYSKVHWFGLNFIFFATKRVFLARQFCFQFFQIVYEDSSQLLQRKNKIWQAFKDMLQKYFVFYLFPSFMTHSGMAEAESIYSGYYDNEKNDIPLYVAQNNLSYISKTLPKKNRWGFAVCTSLLNGKSIRSVLFFKHLR